MFELTVIHSFRAFHFLYSPDAAQGEGPDFGPEGRPHIHDYQVEATLFARELDELGFVADITEVEAALDNLVDGLRGTLLNEHPDLSGKNPSLERLALLLAKGLAEALADRPENGALTAIRVRVWESKSAHAAVTLDLLRGAQ